MPRRIAKFVLIFVLVAGWVFPGWPQIWHNSMIPSLIDEAIAAVAPNGVLIYSDTSSASGKFRKYTNPTTLGSETSTGLGSSVDHDQVVIKRAPTREEFMIGMLEDDGDLQLATCTTGCDATSDYTTRKTISGVVSSSQTNKRAFDIEYESLSGRAMIVYADDPTTGKLYYCLWDGSAFSPQSNCTPTNGTNDIDLTDGATALTGVPRKVKLIQGGAGTNNIWLLVEDENADLYVIRWSGTAWDTATDLTSSTSLSCNDSSSSRSGMCFGLGVENISDTPVLFYTESTNLIYRTFSGGSWSSPTTGLTLSSDGNWIFVSADYESDRLAVASGASARDFRPVIWKADGSTAGLTSGNADIGAESMDGNNIDGFWERRTGNSTRLAMFVYTDSNTLRPSYETATCDGTGCTFSAAQVDVDSSNRCVDDCDRVLLRGNTGGNDMILLAGDIDSDLAMWRWSGSSWSFIANNLTTAAALVDGTANVNHLQFSFWFAYYAYSPWSRNWRWTDDAVNNTPTSWLANENTQPTNVAVNGAQIRLRFNVAELGTTGQTNSRKKLQFTTGDPDSISSTWTDVGAQGSGAIWRYWNGPGADDANMSATALTGSTAVGPFVENGTAASVYDHAASAVSEWDFAVESNGAANNTVYYFRMYDNADVGAVYRQQNSGATPCVGPSACSYPNVLTAAAASLTFQVHPLSVTFPTLTPGVLSATTTTLTIDTSNSSGFNVTVSRDDSDTTLDDTTDATNNITDKTNWSPGANCATAGNATASTTESKTLQFRIRSAGTDSGNYCSAWWGSDDKTANALFGGFPSTPQKIIDRSTASSPATNAIVLYNLDVPTTQKTGTYSGTITFTATVNP